MDRKSQGSMLSRAGYMRQANDQEFERYIGHAHMKLRKPMRDERAGNQAEAPAPAPRSTLDPITATVPCSRIRRYRGVGFDHY